MAEGAQRANRGRGGSEGEGCPHSGFYSGVGLYARDSQTLRCVLVCDECGEEMKEIAALDYVPRPAPAAGLA